MRTALLGLVAGMALSACGGPADPAPLPVAPTTASPTTGDDALPSPVLDGVEGEVERAVSPTRRP